MDLGIHGRHAIVCASSQGLGYACALALAQEGCHVTINGRDADKLKRAAEALRLATGASVKAVQADINTDAGRAALLAACPEPAILINNNAGPPPCQLADWDHVAWYARASVWTGCQHHLRDGENTPRGHGFVHSGTCRVNRFDQSVVARGYC